jgi:outer membrane biosynthesis protein TonB
MIIMVAAVTAAHSQPVFKGGTNALSYFLSDKIIYPEYSRQNCISGTVRVGFRLYKNGKVYDAHITDGLGLIWMMRPCGL